MHRRYTFVLLLLFAAGCREGNPVKPRPSTLDDGKGKEKVESKDGVAAKKDGPTTKDAASSAKPPEAKPLVAELGGEYGLIRISQSLQDRLNKNAKLKARAKDFANPVSTGEALVDLAEGKSSDKAQAVAAKLDAEVQPELRQALDEYVKPDVRDALLRKIEAARTKK